MRIFNRKNTERILCALAGAVIGYLLRIAYAKIQFVPSAISTWLFASLTNLLDWMPADTARTVSLGFAYLGAALPGSVLLGLAVGATILPRIAAKKSLCYFVLLWPIVRAVADYVLLLKFESTTPPEYFLLMWQGYIRWSFVDFVIYSIFFVTVFLSFKFVGNKNSQLPSSTAEMRQEAPPAA